MVTDQIQMQEPTRRPVGRPSVAVERREQIFDAVEDCLVEFGLVGTTMERIAEWAGIPRSAIAHFAGNRDDVIDAAIERSVDRFLSMTHDALAGAAPADRLQRFIDLTLTTRRWTQRAVIVMDEVVAYAHHSHHVRRQLRVSYERVQSTVEGFVADRYPDATPEAQRTAASGLILVLREYDRVRTLGASASPLDLRHQVKALTELIVDSLEAEVNAKQPLA